MAGTTPNYGLTTYEANDKPSWLVGWNDNMDKIDAAIGSAAENASDAVTAVQGQNVKIDSLSSQVTAMNTVLTQQQGVVASMQADVADIKTSDTTQNTEIASLDSRVEALEYGSGFAGTWKLYQNNGYNIKYNLKLGVAYLYGMLPEPANAATQITLMRNLPSEITPSTNITIYNGASGGTSHIPIALSWNNNGTITTVPDSQVVGNTSVVTTTFVSIAGWNSSTPPVTT